uniref:NADH dehydrogenase subunit 6 n=1 Tax=Pulchriphyllium bioculatum TaxID=58609 RepID=UPI0025A9311C|nr:NADH dehydrogenase subunit 6 [Pulchriphyllium bioculatum]WID87104.1 NADH dehydrogenase subunit 6 [Pulchriphyllium bioculatum]
MKILMTVNIMLNTTFLMMKHPLSMSLTIIMQTVIVSMMTSAMWTSSWYSLILMLTYVGGMMIMFIYMTSLIPNMMFKTPKKTTTLMITATIIIMMMINKKYWMINMDMNEPSEKTIMLMSVYSAPVNILTTMMAMYLMLTMITVNKMTNLNMGPLRMKLN